MIRPIASIRVQGNLSQRVKTCDGTQLQQAALAAQ